MSIRTEFILTLALVLMGLFGMVVGVVWVLG